MLTGTLYLSRGTQILRNQYSDIIRKLNPIDKSDEVRVYGWNNRWLYKTSYDSPVSQKTITKRELNTNYYGEIDQNSNLYEFLGFKTDETDEQEKATRNYDKIDEETKKRYFMIECQRRYGISPDEVNQLVSVNTFPNGGKGGPDPGPTPEYEFPSSKVKNWDNLRQHAAEALIYAHPKEYGEKVLRVRKSDRPKEARAFLQGMYKIDYSEYYACQMCHEPVRNIERCEISNNLDKELNSMNLCMCPNCAGIFRKIRNDETMANLFINKIKKLSNSDIEEDSTVVIPIRGHEIWFTQTHVAEIRELLTLKEQIDKENEPPSSKPPVIPEPPTQPPVRKPAQKPKVGSIIFHSKYGQGTVHSFKDGYMYVRFKKERNLIKFNIDDYSRNNNFTVLQL